jgi:regulator of protease activity HflC (stomatin/prohibitin superfamily)
VKILKYPANDASQPLIKNIHRHSAPDFTLVLLRLVILTAAAGVILGFGPLPEELFNGAGSAAGRGGFSAGTALSALLLLAVYALIFSIRKANEWERAIVLRFGTFHKVCGPGLFFLVPLADRVARTVDIRIRVTDFSAQETLTRDSVTVTVDALCFWLVWDPQKAVLELENYEDAVILSSKTALRNAVSSHDLSTFLERGDLIEKQIQEEVDKKTTEWGITVQFVEITDIQIPESLQDSLSRAARAEREKQARILLAEAEIEIAWKLEEAVTVYAKNEPAMKLKILSILNEGLKTGNSMMLVPGSIAEELKTKDIFGLEAITELRREEKK